MNELSPKLRFRYVITSGIMLLSHEPNSDLMNLFIKKTLIEELHELNRQELKFIVNEQKICFEFKLLCFPVDSIARPIIQNRLQFDGRFGCSWCYEEGKYIKEAKGIRYPYSEQPAPLRTNKSHSKDAAEASAKNVVRGRYR